MSRVHNIEVEEFRTYVLNNAPATLPSKVVEICAHHRQGQSTLYGISSGGELAGVVSIKDREIEFISAQSYELEVMLLKSVTYNRPVFAPLGMSDLAFERMGCQRNEAGFIVFGRYL